MYYDKNMDCYLDKEIRQVSWFHPILSSLVVFILVPALMLLAVGLFTTAISVPMAFLLGWV